MEAKKKLEDLEVVLVSHVFVTGCPIDLGKFIAGKARSLLFIGHPFSFREDIRSFYKIYKKGKLKREHKAF